MGLWAEIKYALNSSLGKSSFVPLDELIISNRHLSVSSNVLFVPRKLKSEINRRETGTRFNICNFKTLMSGEIDFYFSGSTTAYFAEGQDFVIIAEIEKNGELIYSREHDDYNGSVSFSNVINVDVNDKVSLYLTVDGSLSNDHPFVINSTQVKAGISDNPITNI